MAAKSLQEQLLGAGLVDKKKLKKMKAEKLQHKQKVKNGKAQAEDDTEIKESLKKQREEKAEKDRLLNLQHQTETLRKAEQAQIRQMIEVNRIPKQEGEIAYHFTDAKKVKQLYISQDMHNQLTYGLLAIVKLDDKYELVPERVAEKIRQRDDTYVLVCNVRQEQPDEDDPYADFQIPDDLMW